MVGCMKLDRYLFLWLWPVLGSVQLVLSLRLVYTERRKCQVAMSVSLYNYVQYK